MRVRLDISYKGTNYAGWQRQTNGLSVQQVLEDALKEAAGAKVVTHAAGRTDAGVHAYALPVHFDTECTIPADKYAVILNNLLPPDISVINSYEVAADWHSQYSCKSRTYEYKILITDPRQGIFHDTHWQIREKLDIEAMQAAAELLQGTHDFKAFSTTGSTAKTTVKTISSLEICKLTTDNCQLSIRVTADGFLYNMVRIIAAQLVKVGRGQITPAQLLAALKSGKRANCRECAPACGLYFVEAEY
jgi:tRNA pseudouridine38-40 synthase